MSGINQLGTSAAQQTQVSAQDQISKACSTASEKTSGATDTQPGTRTQISSLSRLLSDASTRAMSRDSSTSRNGLARIAQSTADKLLGENYRNNKAVYDAEVPNSDDTQRLAQARQATDFANGKGANPFKDMARDQLALITYDNSGNFTVNERRAAWQESYDQEEYWKLAIIAKMNDEYNRTGRVSSDTYQEMLAHYKSLPAIEEAQMPKGYDTQLQTLIQQAEGTESNQFTIQLQSILDALGQRTGGDLLHSVNP